MKITKELLKEWSACRDGYEWFLINFPQGGDASEVGSKLRADKRYSDASWLTNHLFDHFIKEPSAIASYVDADVKQTIKETEGSPNSAGGDGSTSASSGDGSKSASSGNYSTSASSGYGSTSASSGDGSKSASSGNGSKSASSGNDSTSASSGNYSTSASSGDDSKSASSGYGSTSASSGDGSTSASSGDGSKSASSGYGSKSASSGDDSTSASSGYGSKSAASGGKRGIAMVAALNGQACAGEDGAFALAWKDQNNRIRITVGIIGENAKADVWYKLSETGELIEV